MRKDPRGTLAFRRKLYVLWGAFIQSALGCDGRELYASGTHSDT